MKKKTKILLWVLIPVLTVLLAAGITTTVLLTKKPATELLFNSPALTGKDCILVPASNSAKRNVTAVLRDNLSVDDEGNPLAIEGPEVAYTLEGAAEGITLTDDLLTVSSKTAANASLTVTAKTTWEGKDYSAKLKIQVKKDESIQDVPANPLEKEGWDLVFHDEFNDATLDYTKWSPYYLRHWVDHDERTKADYYFEDGSFVLRNPQDAESWSSQNSNVNVKGLMSYEKNWLHKYGETGSGAVFNRDIPTFNGYATKYGYFEIRLKMPDTRDGSHFAWWMVGVQGDQNATAAPQGASQAMEGHHSNETGEIDIIETYLAPLKSMKAWRPVIHPNGTTDYQYHWLPVYTIPGTPSEEYHVYGFEWDENGTKFYVDGKLAGESDRSPNYPMMTFLTTYATGGMGEDRNIYPKDTYVDYFRVYKKKGAPKATNVVLNGGNTPDFIRVPDNGKNTVQMTAQATDQADRAVDATVRWKLSQTIDGFTPTISPSATPKGVSIDPDSGLITVTSDAQEGTDLFVTAYVNDQVKQVYHVKLSKDPSAPSKVLFSENTKTLRPGTVKLNAVLYDQYKQPVQNEIRYQLSTDLSATRMAQVDGVTLTKDGTLTIGSNVPEGTILVVSAKSGGKYNNLIFKVQK